MFKIDKLLIVANSSRMLAQLAKNNGLEAVVIDCFGDIDTRVNALDYVQVKSLALENIKTAFFSLTAKYNISHIIYGSGFERHIDSLDFFQKHLILLGNPVKVFSTIQNKVLFSTKLEALNIPYPSITEKAPDSKEDWLIKPRRSEGGMDISKFTAFSNINQPHCFWQKHVDGIPMSVLFIAERKGYKIIGFHKQLITTIKENEFVFSGLISQPEIKQNIVQLISVWLEKLVSHFTLKGLNSLDFMLKEERCYALELNPRLSASIQLYEDKILLAHIMSCYSQPWDELIPDIDTYRAYQIVFADTEMLIKKNLQWPDWVKDIPQSGCIIHTGLPICSIIARGENEQQVRSELLRKQRTIKKFLQ